MCGRGGCGGRGGGGGGGCTHSILLFGLSLSVFHYEWDHFHEYSK